MKYAALITKKIQRNWDATHTYEEVYTELREFVDVDEMKHWYQTRNSYTYPEEAIRLIQYEDLRVTTKVSVSVEKAP